MLPMPERKRWSSSHVLIGVARLRTSPANTLALKAGSNGSMPMPDARLGSPSMTRHLPNLRASEKTSTPPSSNRRVRRVCGSAAGGSTINLPVMRRWMATLRPLPRLRMTNFPSRRTSLMVSPTSSCSETPRWSMLRCHATSIAAMRRRNTLWRSPRAMVSTSGSSGIEKRSDRLDFAPIGADFAVDHQRNAHLDRIRHDRSDDIAHFRHARGGDVEDQLVMPLQHHARRRLPLVEAARDPHHGEFDEVRRAALQRRVDRHALRRGAQAVVARVQIGKQPAPPQQRRHVTLLARALERFVDVRLDPRKAREVRADEILGFGARKADALREPGRTLTVENAEVHGFGAAAHLRVDAGLRRHVEDRARRELVDVLARGASAAAPLLAAAAAPRRQVEARARRDLVDVLARGERGDQIRVAREMS